MTDTWDGHTLHLTFSGGRSGGLVWSLKCPHPIPKNNGGFTESLGFFETLPTCWQYRDIESYDEHENHPPHWPTIRSETECVALQWFNNLDIDEVLSTSSNPRRRELTELPIKIRWWFEGEDFYIEPLEETP